MTPEIPSPAPTSTPSKLITPTLGFREFASKFLARNPFYLASAALLLFGINRLSLDPTFLGAEEPKLAFNFAALQLYEILLIFVAIVLGVRRIWYDSTLLVVLENGLLLVPFILLTQAILNSYSLAIALSIAGTLMAVTRYSALHRWLPSLKLSPRLLQCGALLLAANLALPIVFRQLMEKSVDDWENPSLIAWLLVLPILAGLANLLPRPVEYSELPPRKSWLPMLLFSLWIGGSAVHLWSIGYVAERNFLAVYLLPLFWVIAWTLYNRIADFRDSPSSHLRQALLYGPMLLPFLGVAHWNGHISFALSAANFAIYLPLALSKRRTAAAFRMVGLNAAVLVAAMPLDWGQGLLADFTRSNAICLAIGAYIMLQASVTGNPAIGLAAAVVVGIAPGFLLNKPLWNEGLHLGCTFLILHSFFWRDQNAKHASLLRFLLAAMWAIHALAWTYNAGTFSKVMVPSSAVAVLAAYFLFRLLRGHYAPVVVLAAAALSLCAVPLHHLVRLLKASPTGLLSIMASFVLFGVGTILAMNKHRWQQALARARKSGR